ncbi:Transmembrane protein 184C [Schistosoma japonicum]|nr:Transmembrane protein 184C [Schistosoma japonicum]
MALIFPSFAIYFDTLRECYEAYVIYNFLAFLLNYLTSEFPDLASIIELKSEIKHLPPFCFLTSWKMGRVFIDHCRHGALQYTVIRPLTTAVALICEVAGIYGEGSFNFRHAFLYLTIINNVSQIWALYCLVMFYRCARQELSPMKPVAKFLCVKFVVFMSFWQSILIAVLAATGVIRKVEAWKLYDVQSIGIALQNFAICIEMFIAAIAHHFSFSWTPYVDPNSEPTNCCQSWQSMWDISDMRRDVVEHVRHVGHSVRHFNHSSDHRLLRCQNRLRSHNSVMSPNADSIHCNNVVFCDSESSPLLNPEPSSDAEVTHDLMHVSISDKNLHVEKVA